MLFDFIRGGQILSHTIKMMKEVIKDIFIFSFFISLIFSSAKVIYDLKFSQLRNSYIFYIAKYDIYKKKSDNVIKINDELSLKSIEIIQNKYFINEKKIVEEKVSRSFKSFFIVYFFSIFSLIVLSFIKGYISTKNKFLRGVKFVKLNLLNKIIKLYNKKNRKKLLKNSKEKYKKYKIANAIFPVGSEMTHTLITGASGTGKTVLITDLLEQIRKNGDRAIVYDRMGTFISKFYNADKINELLERTKNDINITEDRKKELYEYYNFKKDIILNPLDLRSPYWSIFNESRNKIDFDSIASALIPDGAGNVDPFWIGAARTLFSSSANKLKEMNKISNKDLVDILLKNNLKEAAMLVKGTEAQSIIDEQNSKTALSVMAMLSTNLKSLSVLRDRKENINLNGEIKQEIPFSIRKWIEEEKQEGFLFISSRADQHETLKPLISTWLDISVNSLISLEQSTNRKIWIIIDELPSLNFLPNLHTGLAEARQFGGCFVISMQLMAQLEAIYGKQKAIATSGLCKNKIILNTPDEDTAKWCSDNLGKIEMREVKESFSFGANDFKDGVSINEQEIQKNIVLPTEIMQLENLSAFIKFGGDFPVSFSKFKYKKYENISPRYILNDNEENIIEKKINDNKNKDETTELFENNNNENKEEERDVNLDLFGD